MVLTFNCKRDGQCYVLDSNRETQYIVKTYHNPRLSGGVYDDLGLSCLVGIEETDEGFQVSAFDTPLGVFKPAEDCICRMQGEGWEITEEGELYRLSRSGEAVAEIAVKGSEIAVSTENSGQAIMVISASLVALEYDKRRSTEAKKPQCREEKPFEKSVEDSKKSEKPKQEPIITINMDALKARLAKYKLDNLVTFATDVIPSIRFKVQGKTPITMVAAIGVCLVMFITGLVATAVKTADLQNIEWTEAVTVVKKSGATTAAFRVGDYAYAIDLKKGERRNDEKFLIYYTEKNDGTLDKYFKKKPTSGGFVALSVISIIFAIIIFVFMFIGNPLEKYKELNFKNIVKRLRPTSEQNEEERLVEHTAYVTSAELEPEEFTLNDQK